MVKKYNSVDSVKRILNVQSLNHLSTAQQTQLATMLPDMNQEVAVAVINQIQTFTDFGKTTMSVYAQTCDRFLEKNCESQNAAVQGYQQILDGLMRKFDMERISEDERKSLTKDMIEVANNIAKLDESNKIFLHGLADMEFKGLLSIAALTLAAVGRKYLLNDKEETKENPVVIQLPRPRFPPFL